MNYFQTKHNFLQQAVYVLEMYFFSQFQDVAKRDLNQSSSK